MHQKAGKVTRRLTEVLSLDHSRRLYRLSLQYIKYKVIKPLRGNLEYTEYENQESTYLTLSMAEFELKTEENLEARAY